MSYPTRNGRKALSGRRRWQRRAFLSECPSDFLTLMASPFEPFPYQGIHLELQLIRGLADPRTVKVRGIIQRDTLHSGLFTVLAFIHDGRGDRTCTGLWRDF